VSRISLTFDVDLAELAVLVEDLGLDRFSYPHTITGTSEIDLSVLRDALYQRLPAPGGELGAEIAELLDIWARPDVLLTQVATTMSAGSLALHRGGWRGRTGVFTSQRGEVLNFAELRPAQVIAEMVRVLPPRDAIPGTPVSYVQPAQPRPGRIPAEEEAFGGIEAPYPASPGHPPAAEPFFSAPVLRAGVITCSRREPSTRTRRGALVEVGALTWFETAEGGFCSTTEPLSDGARRHTITPADRRLVARWLRDRLDRERSQP
jgi:hypothetical protein